jgi:ParB family chromosome partitioning protein
MSEGKAKRGFDLSAITADLPTLSAEGEAPLNNPRLRFPTVPIAKAIETQHRNAMVQLKELEAAIEQRKAEGMVIDEIDPALADPSPYWDRDQRFLQDQRFADFVEDIRRNTQQSPALLRPHPTIAGRFEVCFGHRRLFACKTLGVKLRAVVRPLSEAQMAGAAYSENAHREGISILEQSRSLAKYVERGVFPTKQALADALGVSRSHVSNLTSYAEIPGPVLEALGDWRKCTFRDAINLLKATRDPGRRVLMLEAAERLMDSDLQLGFPARLRRLLGQNPGGVADKEDLRDEAGRVLAERKRGKRASVIAFGADDGLADFIWEKLPSLIKEFQRQQGRRK